MAEDEQASKSDLREKLRLALHAELAVEEASAAADLALELAEVERKALEEAEEDADVEQVLAEARGRWHAEREEMARLEAEVEAGLQRRIEAAKRREEERRFPGNVGKTGQQLYGPGAAVGGGRPPSRPAPSQALVAPPRLTDPDFARYARSQVSRPGPFGAGQVGWHTVTLPRDGDGH